MQVKVKTRRINMSKEIQQIEYEGQRVLLTEQLAELYGCTIDNIRKNYANNISRYRENVDYLVLRKDHNDFGNIFRLSKVSKLSNKNKITLWTEKGALQHAKSLGTDKAWEMYEVLIDTYFRFRDLANQMHDPIAYARMKSKEHWHKFTDKLKEFVDYAKSQGSKNADMYYMNFAKLIKSEFDYGSRDDLPPDMLYRLSTYEALIMQQVDSAITGLIEYHEAYRNIKGFIKELPPVWDTREDFNRFMGEQKKISQTGCQIN